MSVLSIIHLIIETSTFQKRIILKRSVLNWSHQHKSTQAIAPTPLQRYIKFRNKRSFIKKILLLPTKKQYNIKRFSIIISIIFVSFYYFTRITMITIVQHIIVSSDFILIIPILYVERQFLHFLRFLLCDFWITREVR